MGDAGLEVEWRIIHGEDEFFDVTKTIHNALQGAERALTAEQQEIFRRYNALNAQEVDRPSTTSSSSTTRSRWR